MVFSSVGSESFMSCRSAPATATAKDISFPSIRSSSSCRFGPVHRVGPRPFSTERRLRNRPVHGLPFLVDPLFVIPDEPFPPNPLEGSGPEPVLEPIVDYAFSSKRLRERLPLAPGPQDVEDPIHALYVVHPWGDRLTFLLCLGGGGRRTCTLFQSSSGTRYFSSIPKFSSSSAACAGTATCDCSCPVEG